MNDLKFVILYTSIPSNVILFLCLYREKDVDIAFAQVAIDEYKVEFVFLLNSALCLTFGFYFATLCLSMFLFPLCSSNKTIGFKFCSYEVTAVSSLTDAVYSFFYSTRRFYKEKLIAYNILSKFF